FLELAARAVGARRVMELGSGYGYSAYWFAWAVGPDGEVVCTDGDPENARLAEDYLSTAGVWDRVLPGRGCAAGVCGGAGRVRRGVLRRRQGRLPGLLAGGARPHSGRWLVAV
ncbi:MAG TPA: hypothetical protein VHQ68_13995, partial [Propionibacteriaceae bacterium]|nr:hypothetical protein [Propionibacteriaceae bacterium]